MSSLRRTLAVLDLFGPRQMVWAADDLIEQLGYTRPTGYRYIRELVSAGLLVRCGSGSYTLGPRIVELDYLVRSADLILHFGLPVLRLLVAQTGCDVNLVEVYGDRIVTTHQERGTESLPLSFSRGRAFPLLRGTASRMIVAHFPTARLRRVYAEHAADARVLGYGETEDSFLASCAAVRQAGFVVSKGELDPGMAGVAVPLIIRPGTIAGCLVAALSVQRLALTRVEGLVDVLAAGADSIAASIRAMPPAVRVRHACRVMTP
jgi:DNA-binding IclR family transcriptional regulator